MLVINRLFRWLIALESFLLRHKKPFLASLTIFLLVEAVREALSLQYGDFTPMLRAFNNVLEGSPLYAKEPGQMSYLYSPVFAVVFSPLAFLPNELARFLWSAMFWGGCFASWRLIRLMVSDVSTVAARPAPGFLILSLLPCALYVYINARNGQATHLVMTAILAAYYMDLRGRPFVAGAAWGASLLIKPFPLVFVPFFILRGRWRVLAAALGTVGSALVGSSLFFRQPFGDLLKDWMAAALSERHFATGHSSAQGVWSVINRLSGRTQLPFLLFPPAHLADWLTWIIFAVVAATPCLILMRRGGPVGAGAVRERLAFGLFLIAMAILPPIGWKHYHMLLLFPGALLACQALGPEPEARDRAQTALAAWLMATLLISIRMPPWNDAFQNAGLCLFAALGVFGVLAAKGLRVYREAPASGGILTAEAGADGESDYRSRADKNKIGP